MIDEARPAVPRPEYPRPQFRRERWMTLNGEWEFEIDRSDSGRERGLLDRPLSERITVPFAPESELSGIHDIDFMTAVWYRRAVDIPDEWAGERVLLHFGAVDHDTTVWVDGTEVGRHRGGFSSFTFDITSRVTAGESAEIVVRARDPRSGPQARGKQSTVYANAVTEYTRTTGIWQTVWLEPVPPVALGRPRITPNVAASSFLFELPLSANRPGTRIRVAVSDADGEVARGSVRADLDLAPSVQIALPSDRVRLWSVTDPHLYDVEIVLEDADGRALDTVASYAGLRSVSIDGRGFLINGERVFQRLVLDQGLYRDGILTAPDDDALVRDILLSQAAGFNGARLHQKVFEERFLYHADRLGYLVWGEFADWGARVPGAPEEWQQPTSSFITQWVEVLERDYSHPSIIGWCPLNETFQFIDDRISVLDDVTRAMFLATKGFDRSRPTLDASGYSHRVVETEIWDSHSYEQDPAEFARMMAPIAHGEPYTNREGDRETPPRDTPPWSVEYRGQPYFCSEFGGIWWNASPDAARDEAGSWGYGGRPRSVEEFHERFDGLVSVLLDDPEMFGYCYTQLTDVFQEQNGIYTFDRDEKFDMERIRAVQTRPAAFEDGRDRPCLGSTT
ncbi:glycoside hydrolase family 2 protein [Labedella endophytica]|uniref:Beta-galactosidase n=1 Tax=Labedella endophytica TaxID=1523160 RepID=A0A3S0X8J8_9MICO|nr:sugar-binding domain-containing protein [Labedella endophytica]RUQ98216.1 beta-galactosidase [Labedella endophytica]